MASKSNTTAGQKTTKDTRLSRSQRQENTTCSTSNAKSVKGSKAKVTKGRPGKKRKLENITETIGGNTTNEEHSAYITFVKLKTQEAHEPSGLQTPLSTSDYDMYEDKMPKDIGRAVNKSIEAWLLSVVESPAEHHWRVEEYGEDIAEAFPSGGTPGFARMLKELERKGAESY